jgi:hypothetical protein
MPNKLKLGIENKPATTYVFSERGSGGPCSISSSCPQNFASLFPSFKLRVFLISSFLSFLFFMVFFLLRRATETEAYAAEGRVVTKAVASFPKNEELTLFQSVSAKRMRGKREESWIYLSF